MSRSFKKTPIWTDKTKSKTRRYWRTFRRLEKILTTIGLDIPDPRSVTNSYDYCDFKYDYRKNNCLNYKNFMK